MIKLMFDNVVYHVDDKLNNHGCFALFFCCLSIFVVNNGKTTGEQSKHEKRIGWRSHCCYAVVVLTIVVFARVTMSLWQAPLLLLLFEVACCCLCSLFLWQTKKQRMQTTTSRTVGHERSPQSLIASPTKILGFCEEMEDERATRHPALLQEDNKATIGYKST